MTFFLIALALSVNAVPSEWRLQCAFQSEQAISSEPASQVEIILDAPRGGKPKRVQVEAAKELLGDDYGSKPSSSRRWKLKTAGFDGTSGFIDVTSYSRRPGHSARIWLSGDGNSTFKGNYWVNRGMLSESFAEGDSGEVTCRMDNDGARLQN